LERIAMCRPAHSQTPKLKIRTCNHPLGGCTLGKA
jgi:hypothetical protein